MTVPAMVPLGEPDWVEFEAKLRCAERELALRRRVYPARVAASRMSAADADAEIAAMAAIVHDYAFWGRGLAGGAAVGKLIADGTAPVQPAVPTTPGQRATALARAGGGLV